MKKFTFRSLLAIAAAGVLFTACKDENDDGNTSKTTYEFSVKAEDNPISAPADGKTYTILVTSTKTAQAGTSAVAYEVVSSPEWAPAELEQTALVITVAKNSSTEAREPGKVVLKQDESDKTLEITINQAGFSNSMSLDATYSTDRCKVLVIEPTITGFDQNPVYKWTVKGPNDAEGCRSRNRQDAFVHPTGNGRLHDFADNLRRQRHHRDQERHRHRNDRGYGLFVLYLGSLGV